MPSDAAAYWSSMDFDSESMVSTSDTISSPINTMSSRRQYVDPWDLENYVYMRRHMESTTSSPSQSPLPSPAGEPTSASFLYVPDVNQDFPGLYAGTDEHLFCNARYELATTRSRRHSKYGDIIYNDDSLYNCYTSHTDLECTHSLESGNSASSNGYPYSYQHHGPESLIRPQIVAPLTVALPKCYCQPLYCTPYSPNHSHLNCVDCLMDGPISPINAASSSSSPIYLMSCPGDADTPIPTYDHRRRNKSKPTPEHFRLSQYGHLQIDYSSNWNSLDRYIGK